MAVVGEPTRMTLINEHVGSVGVRITTRGMPAPLRVAEHGRDAIRKMRVLIDVFDDFAPEYASRHKYKDRSSSACTCIRSRAAGRTGATACRSSATLSWSFDCCRIRHRRGAARG